MKYSKYIWIVNPFDQLPNESDIPLRFWSLSRALAKKGYGVTWWSSDFSHKNKIRRMPCPDTDGFSIKLIKTLPYQNNISLNRIRSHMSFSKNFYRQAIESLKKNESEKPFRILVSLPPLGVAESAFKIRNYINNSSARDSLKLESNSKTFCKVVVDIMDAWPEVFYRILPSKFKNYLAFILFYPFHLSAANAYKKADKISAVGQSYLRIAKKYLISQKNKKKPMHLCYHGVDLGRFEQKKIYNSTFKNNKLTKLIQPNRTKIKIKEKSHLRIVYIGALNSGYDLQTIITFCDQWRKSEEKPLQIHFAGKGDQLESLKSKSFELGLLDNGDFDTKKCSITFHRYLKKDELNNLLISSDIALVTNLPDSLVACPYKAGEYAGAGLPIVSCLHGEFNNLLNKCNSGLPYKAGKFQSLYNAIKRYSKDQKLLETHKINARKMAENYFDRKKTYEAFSSFITG